MYEIQITKKCDRIVTLEKQLREAEIQEPYAGNDGAINSLQTLLQQSEEDK